MSKRKRTTRRQADRETERLARDLERIWTLEPGATPERAVAIASPAEVEVHARAVPCPICRGELRVEEHAAEVIGGARLRVARVVCAACRRPRALYYRLPASTLN
jgi:hypothetical protein